MHFHFRQFLLSLLHRKLSSSPMKITEMKKSKCKTYFYQANIKYNIMCCSSSSLRNCQRGQNIIAIIFRPTPYLKLSSRAILLNCLYLLLYCSRFKCLSNYIISYAENGSGGRGGGGWGGLKYYSYNILTQPILKLNPSIRTVAFVCLYKL